MTSTSTITPHSAQVLLEQELACFHEIMSKTQEILDDSDTISLKSILDLLDIRDHWIDRLKHLETKRINMGGSKALLKNSKEAKQISAIAKALVVTDAKLLDILQVRKMNVVKEMGKIAENRAEAANATKAMKNFQQPTIIDTRSV